MYEFYPNINENFLLNDIAPPAPQPPGIMNNGSRDNTKDIQKLQQQLQDIKDQVQWRVLFSSCYEVALSDF